MIRTKRRSHRSPRQPILKSIGPVQPHLDRNEVAKESPKRKRQSRAASPRVGRDKRKRVEESRAVEILADAPTSEMHEAPVNHRLPVPNRIASQNRGIGTMPTTKFVLTTTRTRHRLRVDAVVAAAAPDKE